MGVQDYKQLEAWQSAMDLAEAVYSATASFPEHERFGLTNQLRRAAVSISSNIAEGQGRGNGKDFLRFLRTAVGSTQEVETQILIASRIGLLGDRERDDLLDGVRQTVRLTRGLARSVSINHQPSTINP